MADLERAGARALVIVGESQPPAVHALGHAINETLGAVGTTVVFTAPAEATPGAEDAGLRDLVGEMRAGKVELLVIVGSNPVYAAPADLDFAAALDKVPLRIHHGLYLDETAERCHWHLPASHPLESWGDLRAVDGTVSIVQPLIAPLYNTISETELLAGFTGEGSEQKAYEIVRERWQKELGETDFEKRWNRALHDGVVAGTAFAPKAGEGRARRLGAGPEDAAERRARDRVPARPERLRRPLREPRLAAGAAEAAQQDHVGERRVHEPGHRREARRHRDAGRRRRPPHGRRRAEARTAAR